MPKEDNIKPLTDKEKRFCEEYVIDWNGARAARAAGYSEKTANVKASQLLTKVNIQSYIEDIQRDLSKLSGVTALRNILELKKIAYTNIADFKKDWYTLEDYDNLPDEVKAAIAEIQHSETTFGDDGLKQSVKFKLHDKQKAIELLNKMLGFNEPDKVDVTSGGKTIKPIDWVDGESKDS